MAAEQSIQTRAYNEAVADLDRGAEAQLRLVRLSRRSMFGIAAALPAVVALPAVAAPAPDAELIELGRQWEIARAEFHRLGAILDATVTDEAADAALADWNAAAEPMERLGSAIEAIPATTFAGLRAKVQIHLYFGDGRPTDAMMEFHERPLWSAFDDIMGGA